MCLSSDMSDFFSRRGEEMGGDHMPCAVGMEPQHLTAIILERRPKTNKRTFNFNDCHQPGEVTHVKAAVAGPEAKHCMSRSPKGELHVLYRGRWSPLFL